MNRNKKLLGILLVAIVSVFLAACGGGTSHADTVYYLNHRDGDGFTDLIRDSFAAKAKDAGVAVEFRDAKGDMNLQIDQLKEAIAARPKAIVLLAVDGTAILPAVEKANAAGIPIIITNRGLNGGQYVSCMADDRAAGRMQGEYMAKNLPQGAKIVYLEGELGHGGSEARWQGFKEACLDKRSDIQLLSKTVGNWSTADALKDMTLWLKLYPQIDGVVAANDAMALGAIQALKDASRLDGCLVSGVDAVDAALEKIKAGEMGQTARQDANQLAAGVFQLVEACVKGNTPKENLTVEFESVTKENIGQSAK